MYGVIPAAGEGSRLGKLTDDRPKPLVEVAGRPLIEYGLASLVGLDIEEIVIIIGYRGEAIVEHIGDRIDGTPITYVQQHDRCGLAHAVSLAGPHVDGPFVLHNADNIIRANTADVVDAVEAGADGAMLVESVSKRAASQTGVVETTADRVVGVTEKPEAPASTTVTTGFHVLPEATLSACKRVSPGPTGERELSRAIDHLVEGGYDIVPVELDGWRVNVNTPADIEAAEARLGDRM